MAINPIIPGFSPDPSVIKVDDWFFLVTSTFHMFPGLPIYASQDLTSWRQIGNAIHRPGQLSLGRSSTTLNPLNNEAQEIMLATGGLYAPTIRHRDGIFYVVCTNIVREDPAPGKEKAQNFILTCNDIWACQWSDPIYFDFAGIDPSIFWDDEGKAYIQGSRGPGPMTTISLFEIDLTTGKKLSEEKTIWKGTGGIYPEGPHIYKRNGWYYLEISEGGTHGGHCVTMARSKDLWGPYEENPNNPILTARETSEYIQYTGHCDMFEDAQGQWWGVCLGVRKDEAGRFIMGRETFITPGKWVDDWFTLETVKSNPTGLARKEGQQAITAVDGVDWLYIHDPEFGNYDRTAEGAVTLSPTVHDLSEPFASPTFIGKRQRTLTGTSAATLTRPSGDSIQAGLAVYKDEHRYLRLYYDAAEKAVAWEHVNKAKKLASSGSEKLEQAVGDEIKLSIDYTESEYRLSYNVGDAGRTITVLDTLAMTGPDFTGPVIGVFATTSQEEAQSGGSAVFRGVRIE